MSIQLRVARPTEDLEAVTRFYRDGLGLEVIDAFADHAGFDGVMLGHRGGVYHLEFTYQHGHSVEQAPKPDNLLVFYLPDRIEWEQAVQRMIDRGYSPTPSYNPYWDIYGKTFEDPDGYRVVLQNAGWSSESRL
jgi:catechol 2,3-dioxygenase-like lactoylglutathione lyase family enzyme